MTGLGRRALLTGAAVGTLSACTRGVETTLVVAGGPSGSVDVAFARLLARGLGQHARAVSVLPTSGSLENRQLLERGVVDLALCTADAVLPEGDGLVALGRIYQAFLHVVVRADSSITSVRELAAARVAVPPAGANGAVAARRALLVARGTPQLEPPADWVPMRVRDAAIALASRRVQGMVWFGGLPPAEVEAVEAVSAMRALGLADVADVMNEAGRGAYRAGHLPETMYPQVGRTPTVATSLLLLARPELDQGLATLVVDLLTQNPVALVPATTDGLQLLGAASLIDTQPVPLHPAAQRRYQQHYG